MRFSWKGIRLVHCEDPSCPCSQDLNAKYVGGPLDTGSLSSPPEQYTNPSATGSLWTREFCGPWLHISTRSVEGMVGLKSSCACGSPRMRDLNCLKQSWELNAGLPQSVFPAVSQVKTQCYSLCKWQTGPVKNRGSYYAPEEHVLLCLRGVAVLFSSLTVSAARWLKLSLSDCKPIWCLPKNRNKVTFPRLWGKPVALRAPCWGVALRQPLPCLKSHQKSCRALTSPGMKLYWCSLRLEIISPPFIHLNICPST